MLLDRIAYFTGEFTNTFTNFPSLTSDCACCIPCLVDETFSRLVGSLGYFG